jgi:hypothetical protein
LLTYSPRKESFFKSSRIHPRDLIAVSNGVQSLEEAVANALNFQNLERICEAFRMLDMKLDLAAALRRPFRRRNKSLYDSLAAIIDRRHEFIHRNQLDIDYLTKSLEQDIEDLKTAMERVYKTITIIYSWDFIKTWAG